MPKKLIIQLVSQFSWIAALKRIKSSVDSQESSICDLVNTFAVEDIYFVHFSCENGHQFAYRLMRQISGALFNLLVGNMVCNINIKIHQEVKPSSQISMRTRANNKKKL